ncbi:hypothetical protein GGR51DRAFT_568997 [Nemania sp. FL0031]|nr:hypothetical protein GGR51DRAFT_568997 [Nemania sp. FL0031]
MDEQPKSRPNLINRLPPEIAFKILSALPDIRSLQAVVLSCRTFYSAFSGIKDSIANNVLLNQVDIDVLPEAITMSAAKSTLLPSFEDGREREQAISNFIRQNVAQRPKPPQIWPLDRSLRIGRFHSCVEQWAMRYIAHVPAADEKCTQRALYLFETYWTLFRKMEENRKLSQQKRQFFPSLSREIAIYLVGVEDFIMADIQPVIIELGDKFEFEWFQGFGRRELVRRATTPWTEGILTLGLERLYQITTAQTSDDRECVRAILKNVQKYDDTKTF